MAVGDKLVTLDGLKAVYQDVNGNIVDLKSLTNYAGTGTGSANFYVEQGGINSSGEEIDSNHDTSIRTGFFKFPEYPVTITASTGYGFYVRVYNADFTLATSVSGKKTSYEIPNSGNWPLRWIRITVAKDSGKNINADEFQTAIASGLGNAYCVIPSAKLQDRIKNNKVAEENNSNQIDRVRLAVSDPDLYVDQGGLNSSGIEFDNNANIRTGFLKFTQYPVTIVANDGYQFYVRVYNNDFTLRTSVSGAKTTYEIPNSGNWPERFVRISIAKSNEDNISINDFNSAIASGLENAYCIIPSTQLKNKIENIETQIAGIWYGKKWFAFGDSITNTGYYIQKVNDNLGTVSTKFGHNGYSYAQLATVYTEMIAGTTPDVITIFAGTNDFGHSGTIADMKTGMEQILTGLFTAYPKALIVIITPLQRNFDATSTPTETSGLGPNSLGLYLIDYVEAIKEVAEKYSVPCLDFYSHGGINTLNASEKTTDGLHPNQQYGAVLGHSIANFINNYEPFV